MEKSKSKGDVQKKLFFNAYFDFDKNFNEDNKILKEEKIIANGTKILNGVNCINGYKVPIILLDYIPPKDAHSYAKGERLAFWVKLEDAQYSKVMEQFSIGLREFTIWFDIENKNKLKKFLE